MISQFIEPFLNAYWESFREWYLIYPLQSRSKDLKNSFEFWSEISSTPLATTLIRDQFEYYKVIENVKNNKKDNNNNKKDNNNNNNNQREQKFIPKTVNLNQPTVSYHPIISELIENWLSQFSENDIFNCLDEFHKFPISAMVHFYHKRFVKAVDHYSLTPQTEKIIFSKCRSIYDFQLKIKNISSEESNNDNSTKMKFGTQAFSLLLLKTKSASTTNTAYSNPTNSNNKNSAGSNSHPHLRDLLNMYSWFAFFELYSIYGYSFLPSETMAILKNTIEYVNQLLKKLPLQITTGEGIIILENKNQFLSLANFTSKNHSFSETTCQTISKELELCEAKRKEIGDIVYLTECLNLGALHPQMEEYRRLRGLNVSQFVLAEAAKIFSIAGGPPSKTSAEIIKLVRQVIPLCKSRTFAEIISNLTDNRASLDLPSMLAFAERCFNEYTKYAYKVLTQDIMVRELMAICEKPPKPEEFVLMEVTLKALDDKDAKFGTAKSAFESYIIALDMNSIRDKVRGVRTSAEVLNLDHIYNDPILKSAEEINVYFKVLKEIKQSDTLEITKKFTRLSSDTASALSAFFPSKDMIRWLCDNHQGFEEFIHLLNDRVEQNIHFQYIANIQAVRDALTRLLRLKIENQEVTVDQYIDVCLGIKSTPLLATQIRESGEILSWFKEQQEFLKTSGTEVTSASQRDSILNSGLVRIQYPPHPDYVGVLDISTVFSVIITSTQQQQQQQQQQNQQANEQKEWKYQELMDLQGKLILLSTTNNNDNKNSNNDDTTTMTEVVTTGIDTDKGTDEFRHKLDMITRIVSLYLKLRENGHVDYQSVKEEFNFVTDVSKLDQELEYCLKKWQKEVEIKRNSLFYLNSFRMIELTTIRELIENLKIPEKKNISLQRLVELLWCFREGLTVRDVSRVWDLCGRQYDVSKWLDFLDLFFSQFEVVTIGAKPLPSVNFVNENHFKKGIPNIVPVDDFRQTQKVVLSLFYLLNQIPTQENVLLCDDTTTMEDVNIFLCKTFLSPNHNRSDKIFVIADVQTLSHETQTYFVQTLQNKKALASQGVAQNWVLVVVGTAKSLICSTFRSCQSHFQPKATEEELRNYFFVDTNYYVRRVKSNRAGMGKTLAICNASQEKASIDPITIHISRANSASLVKNLPPQENLSTSRVFHFDIGPAVRDSLGHLFFNFFILGRVKGEGSEVRNRLKQDNYFIEIPNYHFAIPNPQLTTFILDLFPILNIPPAPKNTLELLTLNNYPPSSVLSYALDKNVYNDQLFQKVCRFLIHLDTKSFSNIEFNSKTLITEVECLGILLKYCSNENPTWAYLTNFWRFLSTQVERYRLSPYVAMETSVEWRMGEWRMGEWGMGEWGMGEWGMDE